MGNSVGDSVGTSLGTVFGASSGDVLLAPVFSFVSGPGQKQHCGAQVSKHEHTVQGSILSGSNCRRLSRLTLPGQEH